MSRAACRCNPAGSARIIAGRQFFHFEGVNSISEAETFRGFEVSAAVRTARRPACGQYFVSDLIGCSVFENPVSSPIVSSSPCSLAEAPSLLGAVRDVQFPEKTFLGRPLLEVETSHGEILIPLAVDICTKIDPAARRIDVILPEGLRDLNRGIACGVPCT